MPFVTNSTDPDIKIGCRRAVADLLGIAAHETSHAAHYYHVGRNTINNTTAFVIEGWATFVGYYAQEAEYSDLNIHSYLHTPYTHSLGYGMQLYFKEPDAFNYQSWSGGNRVYTPVFIDAYDDFDQTYWYTYVKPRQPLPNTALPVDQIGQGGFGALNASELQTIAFASRNRADALNKIHIALERKYNRDYDEDMRLFRIAYERLGDESNPMYQ